MRSLSTIVEIKSGQAAPDDFLACLLGAGATIWGGAVLLGGKIIVKHSDVPTLQKIKDLRSIFPDAEMVLHFSDLTAPVDAKSRQPFTLQTGEDGKPAIVAFIEGDYSKHAVKDGIASDEYYMNVEVLAPLVDQFWEATGGNVDATMKFLENKMQQKMIMDSSGERGTVVLLSNTGKIVNISKNDQDATCDWGETSRHHDFGQEKVEEVPDVVVPEPVKEMTPEELMELAMGGSAADTPITTAPVAEKKVDPRIADKQKLTESILATAKKEGLGTTVSAPKDFVRLKIPSESNSQRKYFITNQLKMILPADWKTITHIDVPFSKCPAKLLPQGTAEVKGKDVTPKVVTAEAAQTATKPAGSVPAVAQSVIVPLIPIAQVKAFKETFLTSVEIRKIMEEHSGKLPSEKELEEMQASFPSWSKQTDTPIENTAFYPYTAFLLLCKEYPNLAACLLSTYQAGYFKNFKIQTVSAAVQDNAKQQATGGSKRR